MGEQAVIAGPSVYLQQMLARVPEVAAGAVAPSTSRGYNGHWQRYVQFCQDNGATHFPADPEVISAYLIHLCELSHSLGPALSARSAISFNCKLLSPSEQPPTDSMRVAMVMAGLKRTWEKPKCKVLPYTPDVLKRVRDAFMGEGEGMPPLKDHRMAIFSVMSFHLLGRYEELVKIKSDRVRMLPQGSLEFHIPSAKNYSAGNPQTGVVAPNGKDDCPVDMILEYMERLRVLYPVGVEQFLFPSLSGTGLPAGKPMSYDSARRQLKSVLSRLGLGRTELSRFGIHSGRVGGASTASNHGMDLESVRAAGRWRSLAAPRDYVVADEGGQGAVSALLGSL